MKALAFAGDERWWSAPCPGSTWLEHCALWRPRDPDQITTGDHETAVILLAGTFDLVGGATAWPARGARPDPFAGRPMAVYLPPRTPFHVSNGAGEILLVAARQPAVREPPTGRQALANKPLLPLAGSGKAYDPTRGEWMPAETFPSSPESLPPRRFERLAAGACTIERVFAADYKAATLSVDEVVVPAGAMLRLADIPGRPRADEVLLFVRTQATARVDGNEMRGDAAFLAVAGACDGLVIHAAAEAPAWVAIAYAGKPASGS